MKYLKIPIVDIDDGINNEMMIASDAVLHYQEPINLTLSHLLEKSNARSAPILNMILPNTSFTIMDEKSLEVKTSSDKSIVFVKVEYALNVATGKPIQVYHSIVHDMQNKNTATIFLKSDKTTLCSISAYEIII